MLDLVDRLSKNHEMLALIRNHFPAARYWHAGPYVTIRVPLPLGQEEPAR
jgi:hypothetical protein